MTADIDGQEVDVFDKRCADRECFHFGYDQGSFAQGRGYTSYHNKPRAVCMTRHLRGCPTGSVCPVCRGAQVDGPGSPCDRRGCTGVSVALRAAKEATDAGS